MATVDGKSSPISDDECTALSPEVIVSFSIPALRVDQQLSFVVHLPDDVDESTALHDVTSLVHDCIVHLSHHDNLKVDIDIESTDAKLSALEDQALQALAAWNRGLKLADERMQLADDGLAKAKEAREKMNSMRAAYFKELQHLKGQLAKARILINDPTFGICGDWEDHETAFFNPVDYTFDDEIRQLVNQQVQLLQERLEMEYQEISKRYEEKHEHLAKRLSSLGGLLDKKDLLLSKLMEVHGYQTELCLERAAYAHNQHGKDAWEDREDDDPVKCRSTSRPDMGKAASIASTGLQMVKKMSNLVGRRKHRSDLTSLDTRTATGAIDCTVHKKESRLTKMKHSMGRFVGHRGSEKKGKPLHCVCCGAECGYHICLDCGDISEHVKMESFEALLGEEADMGKECKQAFKAACEDFTNHLEIRKTAEQSVQSDLGGDELEQAVRNYYKINPGASRKSLLAGGSDDTDDTGLSRPKKKRPSVPSPVSSSAARAAAKREKAEKEKAEKAEQEAQIKLKEQAEKAEREAARLKSKDKSQIISTASSRRLSSKKPNGADTKLTQYINVRPTSPPNESAALDVDDVPSPLMAGSNVDAKAKTMEMDSPSLNTKVVEMSLPTATPTPRRASWNKMGAVTALANAKPKSRASTGGGPLVLIPVAGVGVGCPTPKAKAGPPTPSSRDALLGVVGGT